MRVLFYLEPRIELNDPLFRYATLRSSILRQATALRACGVDVHIVVGDAVARRAVADGHASRMGSYGVVEDLDLRSIYPDYQTAASSWLRHSYGQQEVECMGDLLRRAVPSGFDPDVILVWESPAPFLQEIYPSALVLYQWPGFLSRPPFPELLAFDLGLLDQSVLCTTEVLERRDVPPEAASARIDRLRVRDEAFLGRVSPVHHIIADWRRSFDALVLFPLQVDHYFTVSEVMEKGYTQLDAVIQVLNELPRNVGVVLTQYISRNVSSRLLNPRNLDYLRSRFENVLFDASFDEVPSVSQFLVPHVDGVVTTSSSVGFQAAYFKKPMHTLGRSHLTPFSSASSLEELGQQVLEGNTFDRDRQIYETLRRCHLPMGLLTGDRPQLASWLSQLLEYHREGRLARGDWPALAEDDPLFTHLASVRREADVLAQIGGPQNQFTHEGFHAQLGEALSRAAVASFDVFDTLLARPFERPANLFGMVSDQAAEVSGIPFLDFKSERQAAEKEAFSRAKGRGYGETTLEEIYHVLAERLDIDHGRAMGLMGLELEAERQFVHRREAGYRAYETARKMGCRIILISDMYLDVSFIATLLDDAGYTSYERLYVSSEVREKKHSGRLYEHVLSDLDVPPSTVVHVGDNEQSDVAEARKRGMVAIHLPKAFDVFMTTAAYKRVWQRDAPRHSDHWRSVLALAGNGLCDDPDVALRPGTIFSGCPESLGYYGMGPLLLGFSKWVVETARREGIECLYFLARDGKVMLDAYRELARCYPDAPEAHYLLCSRRAVNVAKLRTLEDILDLLHVDYAETRLGHLLEHRFALPFEATPGDVLVKHGLRWGSQVSMGDRPRLVPLLRDLSDRILENAQRERDAYMAYLSSLGLTRAGKAAVVDIGYAGTMQESLHKLTGQPVGGLYLITFRPARRRIYNKGLFIHGYLGQFVDRHDTPNAYCRHVPLYETMFSGTQTSFVRMERDWQGGLSPVFLPAMEDEEERAALVRPIQAGARRFVRQAADVYGPFLGDIDIEPQKALRTLSEFFRAPHPMDARIFMGIRFEDAYGGVGHKVLVPREPELKDARCVWEEGRHAILDESSWSAPEEETMHRMVHWFAGRFLSERKRMKLEGDPVRFFRDSKNPLSRAIGRAYVARLRNSS